MTTLFGCNKETEIPAHKPAVKSPTLITTDVSCITMTSAVTGGNVITIRSLEIATCWVCNK